MKTTAKIRREARRAYRLCLVDGRLDEQRARQVAQRVFQSKHRGYLPLLKEFQRLVKLDVASRTAVVESAEPLTEELRLKVQAGLERAYGAGVTTTFAHDPALIGGMRVKVGSDVYDASVRTRLDTLQSRF